MSSLVLSVFVFRWDGQEAFSNKRAFEQRPKWTERRHTTPMSMGRFLGRGMASAEDSFQSNLLKLSSLWFQYAVSTLVSELTLTVTLQSLAQGNNLNLDDQKTRTESYIQVLPRLEFF